MDQPLQVLAAVEFVALLSETLASLGPCHTTLPIPYTVSGDALAARTRLHVDERDHAQVSEAVFRVNQRGLFCYPVLTLRDAPHSI